MLFSYVINAQENILINVVHEKKPGPYNSIRESDKIFSAVRKSAAKATGTINLFVFNKEKKINLASFGFRLNTRIAQFFHKKIKVLTVESIADLAAKTNALMEVHHDKMIRHLWFDSHGKYKSGYALFSIGRDTLTIDNILDPAYAGKMIQLTAYCNQSSQITIGACYGAVSFKRPGNQYLKEHGMFGDSMLIAMLSIFSNSPVYGSESWVMVKPFTFGKNWGIAS